MEPAQHHISTIASVREIVGEPHPALSLKVLHALDEMSIDFIGKAPFLVLATADANGFPDVSPKGDGPGFVVVEDPKTLLIPERKGNKLLYSLQNILANPRLAVIFLVPGTEETLRVQGRATLTDDPGGLPAARDARAAGPACHQGRSGEGLFPLRPRVQAGQPLATGDLAAPAWAWPTRN